MKTNLKVTVLWSAIIAIVIMIMTSCTYETLSNHPDIPKDSSIVWGLPLYFMTCGVVLLEIIIFYNPCRSNRVPSPFNN